MALDTNVLAYAAGVNDDRRRDEAIRVIQAIPSARVVVPIQVLGELLTVLVRKGRDRELAGETVLGWLDFYETIPTTANVLTRAVGLAAEHRLALWDAIILAAASEAGCPVLLSEDMHDGFTWGGVTIVNPFAAEPHPLLMRLMRPAG